MLVLECCASVSVDPRDKKCMCDGCSQHRTLHLLLDRGFKKWMRCWLLVAFSCFTVTCSFTSCLASSWLVTLYIRTMVDSLTKKRVCCMAELNAFRSQRCGLDRCKRSNTIQKKKKRESGKAESRKDPSDSSHNNNVFIVKTAWVDLLPVSHTPRNTPGNKQRNKMKIIELVPTFATKNSNRWRLREWRH